jgi:hypothetical protein
MENVKEDIKDLLVKICEMGEDTEIGDPCFIENIANKYGLSIDEDLCVVELEF